MWRRCSGNGPGRAGSLPDEPRRDGSYRPPSGRPRPEPALERHYGQDTCLFVKRLEDGRFVWPSPAEGVVTITPGQLGYLLEGIDWRMPRQTWRPVAAG